MNHWFWAEGKPSSPPQRLIGSEISHLCLFEFGFSEKQEKKWKKNQMREKKPEIFTNKITLCFLTFFNLYIILWQF